MGKTQASLFLKITQEIPICCQVKSTVLNQWFSNLSEYKKHMERWLKTLFSTLFLGASLELLNQDFKEAQRSVNLTSTRGLIELSSRNLENPILKQWISRIGPKVPVRCISFCINVDHPWDVSFTCRVLWSQPAQQGHTWSNKRSSATSHCLIPCNFIG